MVFTELLPPWDRDVCVFEECLENGRGIRLKKTKQDTVSLLGFSIGISL